MITTNKDQIRLLDERIAIFNEESRELSYAIAASVGISLLLAIFCAYKVNEVSRKLDRLVSHTTVVEAGK